MPTSHAPRLCRTDTIRRLTKIFAGCMKFDTLLPRATLLPAVLTKKTVSNAKVHLAPDNRRKGRQKLLPKHTKTFSQ